MIYSIMQAYFCDGCADKIIGPEIGADDYMTKPFSIQELTSWLI